MDWPEEPTPYPSYRCHLTKTEGVTKSGNKTVTPANLRQKAPNTLCTGHAAATTMMTTANQEVINIKANKRLVTGNLGTQGTLETNWFATALLRHRTTPDPLHGLSPERIILGNEPNRLPQLSASPRGKLT